MPPADLSVADVRAWIVAFVAFAKASALRRGGIDLGPVAFALFTLAIGFEQEGDADDIDRCIIDQARENAGADPSSVNDAMLEELEDLACHMADVGEDDCAVLRDLMAEYRAT